MKTFEVTIRTRFGSLTIEVQANSEDLASDKAFEMAIEAIESGKVDQIETIKK